MFPHAPLQWEDFAPANGRRILEKYRDRICTCNDNMQGTGAIALAAAISAVRVCGMPLRNHRVVIFGAGTAGIGMADQMRGAMVREGLSREDALGRFWCLDRGGLITTEVTQQPDMAAHPVATSALESAKRTAARQRVRPITCKGVTYAFAQVNHAMLYPGLALGAIVARAARISDDMFAAAAGAVSSLVAVRQAADAEGLAAIEVGDIVQQVQDAMWQAEYRRIEAA